jgi:hypothetical protein
MPETLRFTLGTFSCQSQSEVGIVRLETLKKINDGPNSQPVRVRAISEPGYFCKTRN